MPYAHRDFFFENKRKADRKQTNNNKNRLKKMKITLKKLLLNLLGAFILAFGMYNIHSVAPITEGGALGLTLLLEHLLGISPAVSNIVITVICYAFGLKTFGKEFLVYSGVSALGFSAFYALLSLFPRVYPQIANLPLVAAVIGAVFVGVGVGICVKNGGAPTGDDALAMSLTKRTKIPIQWVYLTSDLVVLGASLCYIEPKKILYSLLTVFLSGQIIGWITREKGCKKRKKSAKKR